MDRPDPGQVINGGAPNPSASSAPVHPSMGHEAFRATGGIAGIADLMEGGQEFWQLNGPPAARHSSRVAADAVCNICARIHDPGHAQRSSETLTPFGRHPGIIIALFGP